MFTYPQCPNAGAKRSDLPYGHASMLLLGEGSEATEPYNKYANLLKSSSIHIGCNVTTNIQH